MGLFTWIAKKFTKTEGGIFFGLNGGKPKKFNKEEYILAMKELMPEITKILRQNNNTGLVQASGENSVESSATLYDWIAGQHMPHNFLIGVTPQTVNGWGIEAPPTDIADSTIPNAAQNEVITAMPPNNFGHIEKLPEKREPAKKPKDVVTELHHSVDAISLENLDQKIQLLKDKASLTMQRYSVAELNGMVERLENRKKYAEFKDFYGAFPLTTDEKIDALLAKYKFKMHPKDIFVPEFPKEAIDVMKAYKEKTIELCGKEPVFYVIAEENLFKKKYDKRDPILLAQSPFAMAWNILGAWDEEMMVLHEL